MNVHCLRGMAGPSIGRRINHPYPMNYILVNTKQTRGMCERVKLISDVCEAYYLPGQFVRNIPFIVYVFHLLPISILPCIDNVMQTAVVEQV